jgi:GT2 family glycosyltransferase
MPTAIRQIELSAPFVDITDLAGYDRCLLVFRCHGDIVGRGWTGIDDGRLGASTIGSVAESSLTTQAVHTWVEHALEFDERRTGAPSSLSATVAICTRERPEDLTRALTAVSRLDPAPAEVLVIDNAPSTSRTHAVVAAFPGVRYVVEPRRGLNCARNRALRDASSDIVAFTDDDAVPEEGWLGALRLNFGDERVLCVTGLTLPVELETPAQELFEEHCSFTRGFSRCVYNGRVENPLLVARMGAGANMAIRRRAVEQVGWFDERLDAGTPTQSGGDHEMFTRILSAGYRIVYEPRAVSWHRHRRTMEELAQVVRGYGVGVYAMWTGLLLEKHDLGVLRLAWRWFRYDHWPLLRQPSRLRASSGRDALRREELRGCVSGPGAWFASRRTRRAAP